MFLVQLGLIGLCIALLPLSYVWVKASDDKFRKLVWVTTFLTLDLVMFGGFTRLTDSGLGCPDWPGCYGTASPFVAHAQIAAAHAALPSGPVSMTKAWIEMIHRYFAMAIGVLIIAQTLIAWVARIKRRPLHVSPWWPTALLALIGVQGAFGAFTVTMKLQPVIVTTHLLLGLALLGALAWLAARMTPIPALEPGTARYRAAAFAGLALLAVQIALGGWVSTNYAVLACTDFPTCNGQWLPPMDFAQGFHLWRALGMTGDGDVITQDALVAIHWTHRSFAFVVAAYLAWLALQLRRFPSLRRPALGMLAVLALQFATGLSNIVLQWPLPIAVAHNGGAAVLLVLLVVLNFRTAARAEGSIAPAPLASWLATPRPRDSE
ncbi:COX15/CtaA family protein [Trinickia caryophylli]|uniref:Cytochrome c oxidase assembly protein subunit 15 n=1 Tax=Trinickia caryophylli TaxID=28094 RepID=A0A1X7EQA3_TRICW|nr:COX15/CtaA family protein [Trinickia caryophylli]PMS10209.1 heme A synthase [Trinickia caryophylli]TRX18679.1 heme A synthase [Trinickia caryophylli]WQE10525.1 COX15/CtaA family protein [Trinickia caryophylli]SMF38128.1 cytochrome c oxidase assembly protein subunit 15 [Trinickia caryophylli]GLU32880.1 cytochrome c oxidase subunit I [Trinickia caryophylli]